MPKVLFVVSGLGAGGAERVIALIAEHWTKHGVNVSIASFDTPADPEFHSFPPEIPKHRIGRTNGGKAAKLENLLDLRRLIKRAQPDVIIPFLTKNNLLALLASAGEGIPVICCERNNPSRQAKNPLWNLALSLAYRRAAFIVCQTEAVKKCFPSGVQRKLRVIPNPISPWSFERSSESQKRIVSVGRLNEQKGFDILLKAFAKVAPLHPDWQLEIFGDGPDRARLARQIEQLGLSSRARLMGNTSVPGAWVRHAGLFVLSSRYEGFPNVLGEAMAAGLPVIAADCEFGPNEMITHEQTGILVPTENAEELATAMDRCLADARLRERLADNGAKAIAEFAAPKMMRLWDEILDEALKSQNRPSSDTATRLEEPAE